jgi:ATP-dependent RNA helicase DeaD
MIAAGRAHGLEPADVVGLLVEGSGLEGEDVEHVRVLERFSLADVPAEQAAAAVKQVTGSRVKGRELKLEVIGGGA